MGHGHRGWAVQAHEIEAAATAPRRRTGYVTPDAAAMLDLQRQAGNRAVTAAVGAWRNGRIVLGVDHLNLVEHPSPPPDGIRKIRATKGGRGVLGSTVRSIEPSPPLLRPEAPVKGDSGWTCRSRPARIPEPYFETYWPTAGRHTIAETTVLDVTDDWEQTLKKGEDEHVADTVLAWEQTWQTVGRAVNALAATAGPPQGSPEAATKDLWTRFRAALPPDLRPAGADPSPEAQEARWGFEPTTLFRKLFDATVARDTRNWHLPDTSGGEIVGDLAVNTLAKGGSRIGEVSSEELIKELRKKYASG